MPAHKIEIVFITVVDRVALITWRVLRLYSTPAGRSKPGITGPPAHSCDTYILFIYSALMLKVVTKNIK